MDPFSIHPATQLGPVRLRVADLQRSLSFYEGVLGLRPQQQADGTTALRAGATPLLILEHYSAGRPKPPRTTGLYHVALLMPTRRDLARTLRRLAEARYPLSGASDHRVSEALYLDDPEGNGLEIYADRPRASWPWTGQEVRMSSDPLDSEGLLAELDAAPWAGLSPATTVGHVHLHVADMRAAEAFYCGVLGFEVMQRFGSSALFIAAGGYHHHLGLNVWAGVGVPPPPADAVGLAHFVVRLPDATSYAALRDRVRAGGLEAVEHSTGLLLRDPSQNSLLLSM